MSCRYGSAVPFFEVTIPNKIGALDGIAIGYSMVPWLFALFLFFHTIWKRTTTGFAACIFGLILITLNEAIIKQIIKEDRPRGSCLSTKGMPSSHSLLSIGYTMWIFLTSYFHSKRHPFLRYLSVILCILFLVPVPSSRVRLKDHSTSQIAVGSIVGVVVGTLFFTLMHLVVAKHLDKLSEHPWAVKIGLVNDYGYKSDKFLDVVALRERRESTSQTYMDVPFPEEGMQPAEEEPLPPGSARDSMETDKPPALPTWGRNGSGGDHTDPFSSPTNGRGELSISSDDKSSGGESVLLEDEKGGFDIPALDGSEIDVEAQKAGQEAVDADFQSPTFSASAGRQRRKGSNNSSSSFGSPSFTSPNSAGKPPIAKKGAPAPLSGSVINSGDDDGSGSRMSFDSQGSPSAWSSVKSALKVTSALKSTSAKYKSKSRSKSAVAFDADPLVKSVNTHGAPTDDHLLNNDKEDHGKPHSPKFSASMESTDNNIPDPAFGKDAVSPADYKAFADDDLGDQSKGDEKPFSLDGDNDKKKEDGDGAANFNSTFGDDANDDNMFADDLLLDVDGGADVLDGPAKVRESRPASRQKAGRQAKGGHSLPRTMSQAFVPEDFGSPSNAESSKKKEPAADGFDTAEKSVAFFNDDLLLDDDSAAPQASDHKPADHGAAQVAAPAADELDVGSGPGKVRESRPASRQKAGRQAKGGHSLPRTMSQAFVPEDFGSPTNAGTVTMKELDGFGDAEKSLENSFDDDMLLDDKKTENHDHQTKPADHGAAQIAEGEPAGAPDDLDTDGPSKFNSFRTSRPASRQKAGRQAKGGHSLPRTMSQAFVPQDFAALKEPNFDEDDNDAAEAKKKKEAAEAEAPNKREAKEKEAAEQKKKQEEEAAAAKKKRAQEEKEKQQGAAVSPKIAPGKKLEPLPPSPSAKKTPTAAQAATAGGSPPPVVDGDALLPAALLRKSNKAQMVQKTARPGSKSGSRPEVKSPTELSESRSPEVKSHPSPFKTSGTRTTPKSADGSASTTTDANERSQRVVTFGESFLQDAAEPDAFQAFVEKEWDATAAQDGGNRPRTVEKKFRGHHKAARPAHENFTRELRSLSTVFEPGGENALLDSSLTNVPKSAPSGDQSTPSSSVTHSAYRVGAGNKIIKTNSPSISPTNRSKRRTSDGSSNSALSPQSGLSQSANMKESNIRPQTHQKKFRGKLQSRQAKSKVHAELPRSLSQSNFSQSPNLAKSADATKTTDFDEPPENPKSFGANKDFLFSNDGDDFQALAWDKKQGAQRTGSMAYGLGKGGGDTETGIFSGEENAFGGLQEAKNSAMHDEIFGGPEESGFFEQSTRPGGRGGGVSFRDDFSPAATATPQGGKPTTDPSSSSKKAKISRKKSEAFFADSLMGTESLLGGNPATNQKKKSPEVDELEFSGMQEAVPSKERKSTAPPPAASAATGALVFDDSFSPQPQKPRGPSNDNDINFGDMESSVSIKSPSLGAAPSPSATKERKEKKDKKDKKERRKSKGGSDSLVFNDSFAPSSSSPSQQKKTTTSDAREVSFGDMEESLKSPALAADGSPSATKEKKEKKDKKEKKQKTSASDSVGDGFVLEDSFMPSPSSGEKKSKKEKKDKKDKSNTPPKATTTGGDDLVFEDSFMPSPSSDKKKERRKSRSMRKGSVAFDDEMLLQSDAAKPTATTGDTFGASTKGPKRKQSMGSAKVMAEESGFFDDDWLDGDGGGDGKPDDLVAVPSQTKLQKKKSSRKKSFARKQQAMAEQSGFFDDEWLGDMNEQVKGGEANVKAGKQSSSSPAAASAGKKKSFSRKGRKTGEESGFFDDDWLADVTELDKKPATNHEQQQQQRQRKQSIKKMKKSDDPFDDMDDDWLLDAAKKGPAGRKGSIGEVGGRRVNSIDDGAPSEADFDDLDLDIGDDEL